MQKKFLVSLTATATAFSMLVAPSLTAFAEDVTEPVVIDSTATEDELVVEVDSITVDEGQSAIVVDNPAGEVTVNGDVTSSGTNGETYTDALGKTYSKSEDAVIDRGGSIDISGTLNASGDEQDAISAYSGSVVTVGDVSATGMGITASDSSVVTVDGSVNSADDAIYAHGESTVIVNGDAISSGMHEIVYSDWNNETKEYDTKKETFMGQGIHTDGSADIFVDGNVIGTNSATIGVYRGKYDQESNETPGSIIVTGTITNASDSSSRISISNSYTRDSEGNQVTATYNTLDDLLASVPDITIYEMDKAQVSVGRKVEDTSVSYKDVYNAVINTINYIIKIDDENVKLTDDNSNIKVVNGFQGESYNTVNINEAFNVAASVPDGFEVNGGENVSVTSNGDGTYTLVLTNLKGGINVKVTAIVRPSSDSNSSDDYEVVVQEVTPAYADPNQAPAGAIVVANTQSAADTPSNVAAISGTKPARTVSYSMSSITPIQYKESIISNVAAAPQGGAMNIETDRVACFDSKMIAAIAARSDIDVNVVFTYGGKKLKVTIPAGYDVNSLLDEFGYCGFLRLMSILGSTEL